MMLKRLAKILFKIIVLLAILRGLVSYFVYLVPSASMASTLTINDFIFADRFAYNIRLPFSKSSLLEINTAQRDDIVIYYDPKSQTDYIKRIIAVSGDKIQYNQKTGTITITPNYQANQCDINQCKSSDYEHIGETPYNDVKSFMLPKDYEHMTFVQRTEKSAVEHTIILSKVRYNMAAHYFKQANYPLGEWVVPQGYYFVMGDNRDYSNDSRFQGFVAQEDLVAKVDKVLFNPMRMEERFFIRIQ